ncbi:MAG TPA: sigma-70 family RNA polymerase sigma factor [Gemmatimonadaceae bacterium]
MLTATYWKPVFTYIRLRWNASEQDAEDLTQDFFSSAFEKEFLVRYDAGRARFRTFLRTCVDHMVMNAAKASSRAKRGGGTTAVPLDALSSDDAAFVADASSDEMDELFRQEWIRSVFEQAVDRLRAECQSTGKGVQLAIFEKYDVVGPSSTPPSYASLATEHGVPETQVTNYLAFARRRLRHHVLETLAALTATDEELAAEAREILGVEIP